MTHSGIDGYGRQAMSEFNVPGMAIGKKEPVDTATLFKIASNSKAFTTAALATLVDDGLISCHGLVIDYIPEFRMNDPWFGDRVIRMEIDQLIFLSEKSPKLAGPLIHLDGNRFMIRWTDRTLEADAYIEFEPGENGRAASMVMSKLDDGDFDFEDLDFTRVE